MAGEISLVRSALVGDLSVSVFTSEFSVYFVVFDASFGSILFAVRVCHFLPEQGF